jgi:CDP-diacylglycerol--serine O-phosphatidyltransferase
MKKHIPNTITLLNLVSGCIAILLAMQGLTKEAAIMILVASVFDFADGLAARLLHVKSEKGKELDSLSDMVSFGVAPAVIIYRLYLTVPMTFLPTTWYDIAVIPAFFSLLFPCFVALRLAKFNLDKRQTDLFYGLPSPAAAFVLISFAFFPQTACSFVLYSLTVGLLCVLMLVNLPLLSLKFKDFHFRTNVFRYTLIFFAAVLVLLLKFRAIPFIILLYLILSFIDTIITKRTI